MELLWGQAGPGVSLDSSPEPSCRLAAMANLTVSVYLQVPGPGSHRKRGRVDEDEEAGETAKSSATGTKKPLAPDGTPADINPTPSGARRSLAVVVQAPLPRRHDRASPGGDPATSALPPGDSLRRRACRPRATVMSSLKADV